MRQYAVCHPLTLWKICSERGWNTRGAEEECVRIFHANENGAPIEKIASMIWNHSYDVEYKDILKVLQTEQTKYLSSIKELENKPMAMRVWRVYGLFGQEQKVSFRHSFCLDFSKTNHPRIIECDCYDKTGTHDYVVIRITRETPEQCFREFWGQLNDGIFENVHTGKIEEIV